MKNITKQTHSAASTTLRSLFNHPIRVNNQKNQRAFSSITVATAEDTFSQQKNNQKKNLNTTAAKNQLFKAIQTLQFANYSTTTTTHLKSAQRQQYSEEKRKHKTIIITQMSSSSSSPTTNTTNTTTKSEQPCCGGNHHHHDHQHQHHLTVGNDTSPNSLSGDEAGGSGDFSNNKKKVSGINMKKRKPSTNSASSASSSTSSLSGDSCTIDYSQLSSHNEKNSRQDPSDPTLSYTIEGLLEKRPNGINASSPIASGDEELTLEEIQAQQSYEKLLNNNKEFVKDKLSSDPDFFNRIKDVQTPDYLLIGCSDSRVPPDQLTKTQPGQIFIHRNVANLVVNTDVNAMSVIQYAVEVLQVKHVIVMGHTRCGGVMAALTNKQFGLIDHWLRNIKDIYRLHKTEVDSIEDKDKKIARMIELNVIEQTLNLCKTSIVQSAWAKGRALHVHGWICDIETGLIKDLEIEEKRWKEIESIYKYDFDL